MDGRPPMESEERLDELANLPRSSTRAGFTSTVLARIETREERRHVRHLAIAIAISLIVAVLALEGQRVSTQRAEARRDLIELRNELARIESRLPARPEDVVLVGGNEDVDFVIDLRAESDRNTNTDFEATYY